MATAASSRITAALLALGSAGCVTGPAAAGCEMAPADRAWLEGALGHWREVEPAFLKLPPSPLPTIAAIDGQCTYLLPQGDFDRAVAMRHEGIATLPDGEEAPIGPISFASGAGGYFAMSLPSVWREAGVTSGLGLERLMDAVLLHEMMHIRQAGLATRLLEPLAEQSRIAENDLTDDIVQQRFGSDPAYAAAWAEERDRLFAAAAAATNDEARSLAAEGLAMMRARHARWFAGEKAAFREFDDIFLTMEGMGQWLAYRFLLTPEGGAISPEKALAEMRRGGGQWSQDHGLALMLVVDRLLPGWQQRAFRDPDWRAERLLAAAVER